jgi:hypothetical protein
MPDCIGGESTVKIGTSYNNVTNFVRKVYNRDRYMLMMIFIPILFALILSISAFVMSAINYKKDDCYCQNKKTKEQKMLEILN